MEWLTPANVVIVILVSAVGYKTLELLVKKLSLTGTPGTTMTWLKTNVPVWYAEEWVKASVGGVVLIILLALLNKNLAWWLSGHHPRLFISLVLLVVLGVFVLKKDYDRTKKWLWRAGFAIVLVFGVGGAILEDRHNGEPNLDKAIVGGEQREVLKEVAQEVAAAMPEISMPSFPSLSPAAYTAPAPAPDTFDATLYTAAPGQWTEIVLQPASQNKMEPFRGEVQIVDSNGNFVYQGPYRENFSAKPMSRFFITSLDVVKIIQMTHRN